MNQPTVRELGPTCQEWALVGLGANQGDAIATLRWALRELAAIFGPLGLAPLYRTAPESTIPQDDFYNTVASFARPAWPPARVLGVFKRLEQWAGRRPGPRNGPRPLDLDLLIHGDWVGSDATGEWPVSLPHPRLRERRFVMAPLADLAPALCLPPDGARVAELWEILGPHPDVRRCEPDPLADLRRELANVPAPIHGERVSGQAFASESLERE